MKWNFSRFPKFNPTTTSNLWSHIQSRYYRDIIGVESRSARLSSSRGWSPRDDLAKRWCPIRAVEDLILGRVGLVGARVRAGGKRATYTRCLCSRPRITHGIMPTDWLIRVWNVVGNHSATWLACCSRSLVQSQGNSDGFEGRWWSLVLSCPRARADSSRANNPARPSFLFLSPPSLSLSLVLSVTSSLYLPPSSRPIFSEGIRVNDRMPWMHVARDVRLKVGLYCPFGHTVPLQIKLIYIYFW